MLWLYRPCPENDKYSISPAMRRAIEEEEERVAESRRAIEEAMENFRSQRDRENGGAERRSSVEDSGSSQELGGDRRRGRREGEEEEEVEEEESSSDSGDRRAPIPRYSPYKDKESPEVSGKNEDIASQIPIIISSSPPIPRRHSKPIDKEKEMEREKATLLDDEGSDHGPL